MSSPASSEDSSASESVASASALEASVSADDDVSADELEESFEQPASDAMIIAVVMPIANNLFLFNILFPPSKPYFLKLMWYKMVQLLLYLSYDTASLNALDELLLK